jgi:Na+/glutamate symporter
VAALFLVFSVLTATWVIAAQAVFLGACGMALVAVPMAVRIDVRMAVRRSR